MAKKIEQEPIYQTQLWNEDDLINCQELVAYDNDTTRRKHQQPLQYRDSNQRLETVDLYTDVVAPGEHEASQSQLRERLLMIGFIVCAIITIGVTTALIITRAMCSMRAEGDGDERIVASLGANKIERAATLRNLVDIQQNLSHMLWEDDWILNYKNWYVVPTALKFRVPRKIQVWESEESAGVPSATLDAVTQPIKELEILELRLHRSLLKPDAQSARRDGNVMRRVVNNGL